MDALSLQLQNYRNLQGLSLREAGKISGLDPALINKFEKGSRLPNENHLRLLAETYNIPKQRLVDNLLVEKIYRLLETEKFPKEILSLAETRIEYLVSRKSTSVKGISKQIISKLEELDKLKEALMNQRPAGTVQMNKLKEYFNTEYTFESNRIEGSTLTLQETHLIINEGITISGKTMKEHLEAVNHQEAIEWLYELSQKSHVLRAKDLSELHYLVLKGIDKSNAGVYRQVPVRISGSKHIPPEPFMVDSLMHEYWEFYHNNNGVIHPILLAAEMHERLVSIHPFIDGNGRTSRLIMNLILIQNGYSLCILKGDATSRMNYYNALEKIQISNEPEQFYNLVIDRLEHSMREHLNLLGGKVNTF